MTDEEKAMQAELEAVTQMLGGFPPDFEHESPEYQLAWLQQHVAQLQQEIVQLEAQVSSVQQRAELKVDDMEKASRAWAANMKQKADASSRAWLFSPKPAAPQQPTPKFGFGDFLGGLFDVALTTSSAATLEAKKLILSEMQLRQQVLAQKLPAATTVAKPTRQQQIDAILADIAQVNAECTKVCATITDQALRDQITLAYEDKARKLYEQIAKL